MDAPKPLARLADARIDQPDVAPLLKTARRLIKARKYVEARKLIERPLVNTHDEVRRLRILAESWGRDGRGAQAAECLRLAYKLQPSNHKVVADYLTQLVLLRNIRAALILHEKLTKRHKRRWQVMWAMHRLYERMGWMGHADQIRRRAHISSNRMDHLKVLIRRIVRPLSLRIEKSQLVSIKYEDANLDSLDKVTYRNIEQRYYLQAELDRALLETSRAREFLDMLFSMLRVAYPLITGGMLALFLLLGSDEGAAIFRLAAGMTCASVMYLICRKLWDSTVTYTRAVAATFVFALICLTIGTYFLRFAGSDFLQFIGMAVYGGTAIVVVFAIGNVLTIALEGYVQQRVNRNNARGVVLNHLADLIAEIADSASQTHSVYLCWKLESAAKLLERDVPRQLSTFDNRTTEWLARQCAGGAEALRHMKRHVLSPHGGSWDHISRLLRQQLAALASENWHNLVYRQPSAKPTKSKREKLTSATRFAVIALLPAVSLYTVAPWLDFGSDTLKWARIVAFGWAILSVLIALDPRFREKIETAGEIVRTARGTGDKTRRDEKGVPTD